jgi:hypothetical protein
MAVVGGKFKPTASPNCPDYLKPVINQCFSYNPNDRPIAGVILSAIP